jgi:lipoprotein-anchoring transpeptidase ErfK/SrfK
VEFYEKGEYVKAAGWFEQFLKTSPADHVDVALLYLGRSYARSNRFTDAVLTYKRVASERAASLLAGDALYELGRIGVRAKKYAAAQEYLERAWRTYPESDGGRKAALILADGWYERYCGAEPVRAEWEKIRDAYSVALRAEKDPDRREELVERLDRLNKWLIFGPGKCRNACYYLVKSGDTLSEIAARFRVPVGAIKRMNGIPRGSAVVRAEQRLKILRGTFRMFISKSRLKLTATIDGKFFREYPVGIGNPERSPTPEGTFTITRKVVDPTWFFRGKKIPPDDPRNILGTRWMGFYRSGPGSGYGIHGTTLPDTIPGRKSGGCVRMFNEDVEELFDFTPKGTKVVTRAN